MQDREHLPSTHLWTFYSLPVEGATVLGSAVQLAWSSHSVVTGGSQVCHLVAAFKLVIYSSINLPIYAFTASLADCLNISLSDSLTSCLPLPASNWLYISLVIHPTLPSIAPHTHTHPHTPTRLIWSLPLSVSLNQEWEESAAEAAAGRWAYIPRCTAQGTPCAASLTFSLLLCREFNNHICIHRTQTHI